MLSVQGLSKSFQGAGGKKVVFDDFNFESRDSSIAIFGPNGCGKTTFLQMLCGLSQPDAGRISICGKEPKDCHFSYVFQNSEGFIFPWLNNLDNVTLSLKLKKQGKGERRNVALAVMKELDVEIPLDTYPYQLSGGQKQIVMLLRALVEPQTDVLLLDEPFLNLDYLNSLKILKGIHQMIALRGLLVIFVSHTIEEAVALSDSIVVLAGSPTRVVDTVPVPSGALERDGAGISGDYLDIRERVKGAFDGRKKAVPQP